MPKLLFFTYFVLSSLAGFSQNNNEKAILAVLDKQSNAWNNGSLDEFMKGYWQNDSLMFIGKSGITYGYNNTLNNYRKNYSDAEKMGKLFFEILKLKRICADSYFVVGKWFLKRSIGDAGSTFTLLFKKINGRWQIIADHSS